MPSTPNTSVRLKPEVIARLDQMVDRIQKAGAAIGGINRSRVIELAIVEGLQRLEERYPGKIAA